MNSLRLKTMVVGIVLGLLFALLAITIVLNPPAAFGIFLFIVILLALFIRSITRGRSRR